VCAFVYSVDLVGGPDKAGGGGDWEFGDVVVDSRGTHFADSYTVEDLVKRYQSKSSRGRFVAE